MGISIIIYEAAAKRGDKQAQYWMGQSLQHIDPQASLKWLMGLAHQGDTKAMKTLALGYCSVGAYGENPEKELYWYLEAGKLGDAEAQYCVGREYVIKKDFESAWEWYAKASEQGYTKGTIGLADLLIKKGERYVEEIDQKYHYDFANALYQQEREQAKIKCGETCVEAENLLFDILDGEYYYEDAAKALDMLGDLYRYNRFYDSAPKYELAVQYYYMATLFDEEDDLISKSKMERLIEQQKLEIPQSQFDEWKRAALDE